MFLSWDYGAKKGIFCVQVWENKILRKCGGDSTKSGRKSWRSYVRGRSVWYVQKLTFRFVGIKSTESDKLTGDCCCCCCLFDWLKLWPCFHFWKGASQTQVKKTCRAAIRNFLQLQNKKQPTTTSNARPSFLFSLSSSSSSSSPPAPIENEERKSKEGILRGL